MTPPFLSDPPLIFGAQILRYPGFPELGVSGFGPPPAAEKIRFWHLFCFIFRGKSLQKRLKSSKKISPAAQNCLCTAWSKSRRRRERKNRVLGVYTRANRSQKKTNLQIFRACGAKLPLYIMVQIAPKARAKKSSFRGLYEGKSRRRRAKFLLFWGLYKVRNLQK